ncbi:hypothetical protein DTO207G8_4260 [Paecilomyces variotii]|nr:hypothetical protein DTO169C6_6534 [Paecilomyces variotii]KAJ9253253.1 hypothetical protein DTO207G8_4260 [Paecilomyces variotii]
MAEDEKQTAAAKQRIITHMNSDHQDSLAMFLQVYNRLNASTAKSAQLEDVSISDMVIKAGDGARYTIPIEPPMKSLLDARHRFVDMHDYCLSSLGISDIKVEQYSAPRGHHTVIFALCLATYVSFSRRENFLPGSLLYDLVFKHFPRFTLFCYDIQPLLISLMVAIHACEATYMALYRLRPYRVPFLSGLWWTWMTSCFIEGFGSFQRFDAIVRKEKAKKQQQKPNLSGKP